MAKSKSKEGPKTLSSLKSGLISRTWAIAKMGVRASQLAQKQVRESLLSPEGIGAKVLPEKLREQMEALSTDLGQLKGSLMKVGQMLSVYGEHFLPPEANQVLKSLQSESPPLEWSAIQKVLRKELGPERLKELDIESQPLASASIGQVHRATVLATGQRLALKIQYPGVDKAIASDLKALKSLLLLAKWLPSSPRTDHLFQEVREMLHQEVDYSNELNETVWFFDQLKNDNRYIVPKPLVEYSTKRVLATTLEEGAKLDSPAVQGLSLERRNRLATAFLDLYLRELFDFRKVQTDPHIGNYRVKIDSAGDADRLICFDFGATRAVPQSYLENYIKVVKGALDRNQEMVVAGAENLGILQPGDSPELIRIYCDLCYLIVEPYQGIYDWGQSDLPKRVARKAGEMAKQFSLRAPPKESVFLDRKLGGSFIFLSVLRAIFDGRPILKKYL